MGNWNVLVSFHVVLTKNLTTNSVREAFGLVTKNVPQFVMLTDHHKI